MIIGSGDETTLKTKHQIGAESRIQRSMLVQRRTLPYKRTVVRLRVSPYTGLGKKLLAFTGYGAMNVRISGSQSL